MITREELLNRLASLPAELEAAEGTLLAATRELEEARNVLAARRVGLLLEPEAITGRNEHQRDAQLFDLTHDERAAVTRAEAQGDIARLRLHRLQHEFASARSCVRLLTGEGREP